MSYFIGMVCSNSRAVLADLMKPCLVTAVTFEVDAPDKAGRLLTILSGYDRYADALSAALMAGFNHRSANLGEYQLAVSVKPGDMWACVVYGRKSTTLLAGFHNEVNLSLFQLASKGRVIKPSGVPLECLFQIIEVSGTAVMA